MNIQIHPEIQKELEYMVELYQLHGCPAGRDSLESLISYILASIADGSRRPGSWERSLLEMLGLVADCGEHYQYRSQYGKEGA